MFQHFNLQPDDTKVNFSKTLCYAYIQTVGKLFQLINKKVYSYFGIYCWKKRAQSISTQQTKTKLQNSRQLLPCFLPAVFLRRLLHQWLQEPMSEVHLYEWKPIGLHWPTTYPRDAFRWCWTVWTLEDCDCELMFWSATYYEWEMVFKHEQRRSLGPSSMCLNTEVSGGDMHRMLFNFLTLALQLFCLS